MGDLIAAVRVTDTLGPILPGAERGLCNACKEEVLLAPSSLAIMETSSEYMIVCNRCLPGLTGEAELEVGNNPLGATEVERLIETTPDDRRCAHGLAWCPECDGPPRRTEAKGGPADNPALEGGWFDVEGD